MLAGQRDKFNLNSHFNDQLSAGFDSLVGRASVMKSHRRGLESRPSLHFMGFTWKIATA